MNDAPQKTRFPAVIAIVVTIIVLVPSLLYLFRDSLPQSSLVNLGDRAFGELSVDQAATQEALSGKGASADESKPSLYPIVVDEFPYPEYSEKYEYLYEGTLPDLSTIDPTVYRRVGTLSLPSSISSAFSDLTLGILPLSNFKNLELLNLTLAEEDDSGFSVVVDVATNSFSISRNQGYWLALDYSRVLRASDIPSDEVLINKADQFIRDYGVDTSGFGAPLVDRSYFDLDNWVPESVSVTYPYIINGQSVWSTGGQPSGMSVTVNIRSGEVDGLWTIGPSTLEASTYTLVTDPTTILEAASRGSLWDYVPENPTVTYTFLLGEPELVLAEHYQYATDGTTSTLYVPALKFPITQEDPDAPYHQRSWVVVPLVQDILDETAPQPYVEEGVEKLEVEK
ncbi:hypothetical protein HY630_00005 [Candidatus Uhrbacteria bacterium]|nr:hypothetical protein [Candidatus Uhrbacteria bacterium]